MFKLKPLKDKKMKKIFLIAFVFSSLIAAAIVFNYFPASVPKIFRPKTTLLIFPKGSTYEKLPPLPALRAEARRVRGETPDRPPTAMALAERHSSVAAGAVWVVSRHEM